MKYGYDNDPHVLSGLIRMYAEMGFLNVLKYLFLGIGEGDLVSQTTMVVGSAKLGDIGLARKPFDEMPVRDVVAWKVMVAGYVQCVEAVKGLELFGVMEMMGGLKVNESSMVAVLSVCTGWVLWIRGNGRIGSALVDMYAKCGDIKMAMDVFMKREEKNVYTWSTAMGGLAMNGYGDKCVKLFSLMQKEGLKPNEVTFTSVLKGCSVAGFVKESVKFFGMIKGYGIEPQAEHHGCVVDLYGAWGALLKASKHFNNVEMAELASKKMIELERLRTMVHFNEWDSVDGVRHKMKSERVIKVPGLSLIETHA
ncbi:Pentatricopeptide repeat-containing protein [Artemisia annua]|uniref:Pentatricopeptide repeat-containing protein n=1 Tax=Artemisia annua TaxID=35608 RepID=A0A2U1L3M7_ARTAN|nr:Pentatricopeptide repeat-containing protein [Artemisia annua]